MAYFNQEKKAIVKPLIDAVLKKYSVKGSIAVHDHSSLVVTLRSGDLNLMAAYNAVYSSNQTYAQINHYHFSELAREWNYHRIADFIDDLVCAMRGADWYNKTDIMTDYFDTAYYIHINVGQYNKPYVYKGI